jgi:hypothetical protein
VLLLASYAGAPHEGEKNKRYYIPGPDKFVVAAPR